MNSGMWALRLGIVVAGALAGSAWSARVALAGSDSVDGGVVGSGSPASCTSFALDQRLAGGGTVTFNCGASPHTIVLTTTKSITLSTTLDGGGRITLSGNDALRLFSVAGAPLTLRDIALERGVEDGNGGCVFVDGAGALTTITTTFRQCRALTLGFPLIVPESGGAIYGASGAVIALTNTQFISNTADRHGGAVYIVSGTLTFNGGGVLTSTARGLTGTFATTPLALGGGIYVGGGRVAISNVTFLSNTALTPDGYGGGLYLNDDVAATVNGSRFVRNAAGNSGGGIYAENGTLAMSGGQLLNNRSAIGAGQASSGELVIQTGVVFSGNVALSTGGGAHLDSGVVSQTNVVYTGNVSLLNGGAVHSYGNLQQHNALFVRNTASDDGGAVFQIGGQMRQTLVTYTANTAGRGAGVFAQSADVRISDARFISNTANDSGGGLYGDAFPLGAQFTLGNVHFNQNRAANRGGGLVLINSALAYTGGSLMTNTVSSTLAGTFDALGGGAYILSGTTNITGVSFISNTARGAAGYGGGAYLDGNVPFALVSTVFERNAARYGGGIFHGGGHLSMTGDRLNQNSAFLGGGLNVSGAEAVAVQAGVAISGNVATQQGGGVMVTQGALTQTNVVYTGNFAINYGGGLFAFGYVHLDNVVLARNATMFDGGGIARFSGSLRGIGVNLTDNTAARNGAGLYSEGGSGVQFAGSQFIRNAAQSDGGGMYVKNTSAMLDGATFISNTAGTTIGFGGGLVVTGTAPVTLTAGVFKDNVAYTGGGGLFNGGTRTVVRGTSFVGNVAETGGGVQNRGALWLSETLFDGNAATFSVLAAGAGAAAPAVCCAWGGGLHNLGVVSDVQSVYFGNIAQYGGGLANGDSGVLVQVNGRIISNSATSSGGGLSNQGGLTQTSVSVAANASDYGGGLYQTGGASAMTLERVFVTDNSAGANGGGMYLSEGRVVIDRSFIRGNVAGGDGGGVDVNDASATIVRTAIDGNDAARGGGVLNDSNALVIDRSTLSNNRAATFGGAMRNRGQPTLINTSVSANSAITGGGINNHIGVITLTNVTLKDNAATDGGGIYNEDSASNDMVLRNTIIADSPSGGNCKGKAFAFSKYSLSTDATCALAGVGDINGASALLGPLLYNGGATKTHMPQTGSAAIDGILGSDAPSQDQRGAARPADGDGIGGAAYDIGAVEVGPSVPNDLPFSRFLPSARRDAANGW